MMGGGVKWIVQNDIGFHQRLLEMFTFDKIN